MHIKRGTYSKTSVLGKCFAFFKSLLVRESACVGNSDAEGDSELSVLCTVAFRTLVSLRQEGYQLDATEATALPSLTTKAKQ